MNINFKLPWVLHKKSLIRLDKSKSKIKSAILDLTVDNWWMLQTQLEFVCFKTNHWLPRDFICSNWKTWQNERLAATQISPAYPFCWLASNIHDGHCRHCLDWWSVSSPKGSLGNLNFGAKLDKTDFNLFSLASIDLGVKPFFLAPNGKSYTFRTSTGFTGVHCESLRYWPDNNSSAWSELKK